MISLQQQKQYLFKTFLGIFLTFIASNVSAENQQEQAIQAPVYLLHEKIISIMKDAGNSDFQERYIIMEDVIIENFDTGLISKVVLSRYWKSLDDKAQTDFIDLFNRLTISTYVDRFDSYNGESFNNLSIEPMKKNRFMVKTELVQTDDEPVSFNYIVQKNNEHWKIISVIADGVNDLSLKRVEYSSVIKRQGYDALVKSLKGKISDLQPK